MDVPQGRFNAGQKRNAAITAASASAAVRSGANGTPIVASSSFDARSDSVVVRRDPARDDTVSR